MPRTLGECFVHVDDIDLAIEVDSRRTSTCRPEIGDVERRIGEYVAELVPDGATIQMGIGAIPTRGRRWPSTTRRTSASTPR